MLWSLVLVVLAVGCVICEPLFMSTLDQSLQPCYSTEGTPDECLIIEEHKRGSQESLEPLIPCSCQTMMRLLDLGRDYFPRYLPSVTCASSCGPYQCRHRHYEVRVLKRRDKADEISRRQDLALPESLRDLWKFVLVKVVVACECSI